MADLGTAYVRVIPDMTGLNARVAGYFSSSQWSKLGKGAGLALGAGIAAGGAVKALYEIGQAFDDANDKIRVGTGATGKRLKGLENDFKRVVKTVPTDFGNAADAVADLNRRLGVTGKPLRQLSRQMLEMTRLTGGDLQSNIQTTTRLFGDWSVKTSKQDVALNKLFRASQQTGVQIDTLAGLMVQFGSPLRQLGLDFDTAAAMFSRFEREGVNIQTAMPGLRMALKNFAADGREPAKALRETFTAIREAGSTAKANTLAFETFGTRAGPDMAAAIREGRFDLDKLIKSIEDGSDTIGKASKDTRDFSENWQIFKNRVMVGLEPLSRKVFQGISAEAKEMFKILNNPDLSLDEKLEKVFGRAMERIGEIAPKLAGAFVKAWWNAGVWAKLATFAFVAWKFGLIQKMATNIASRFAAWFAATAGTRMAAALALDGAIGSKFGAAGRWTKMGTSAGKFVGRGLVVGIVAGIALYGDDIAREIKKAAGIDSSYTPGRKGPSAPPSTSSISENLIGIDLGFRAGGKVKRFAGGGMVPSLVSSGELLAFPDGSTVQVPGARVAADNVLTGLPVGTAVFTGHGQSLLAGGTSPADALARQMPHFASGGTVAQAAKEAGFRGSALLRMVAEAGGESGWNERAVGDGGASKGLWQIHTGWNPWARNMRLFDPFVNAKAARRIFRTQGFGAWHADHTPWIGRARQAVASIQGQPLGAASHAGASHASQPTGPTRLGRSAISDLRSRAFELGRSGAGFGRVLGALSRAVRSAGPDGISPKASKAPKGLLGGARTGVPGNLMSMARKAASISSKNFPYLWGGGHNASISGPFDCSGAVSAVLDAGGYGGMPLTSGGFMNWGQPGRGRYVSLYTGPSHVFMRMGTKYFGTSGQNPGGGANWIPRFPGMPSGGVIRHPKGLRRGGMVGFSKLPKRLQTDPLILREFERTGLLPGFRAGGVGGSRSVAPSIGNTGGSRGGNIANPNVLRDFLELLHLAGSIARQADVMGRRHKQLNLDNRVARAMQGTTDDPAFAVTDAFGDKRSMERRRNKLRRAREFAIAAGDKEAAKTLTDEIRELNTGVKEATISWIEAVREAARAVLEKAADLASAARESAGGLLENLGLKQQLAGTFDTTGGRATRSAFITSTVIPAIQGQIFTLSKLMKDALAGGDIVGFKSYANQILGLQNEILGLRVDATDLLKDIVDNTSEQTQVLNDLLKEQSDLWRKRFQVSQAQYGVFKGMPPFGGSFAAGGVVPGPVGAPRTIVAHGGEPVGLPGQQVVTVVVEDGAVDPNKIRVIAQGEMRRAARTGGRGLPGRAGVLA